MYKIKLQSLGVIIVCLLLLTRAKAQTRTNLVLSSSIMKADVDWFNSLDSEDIKNYVPNTEAYRWLSGNIPLFECPDTLLQSRYYFRWWSLRKHLVKTPVGFVFTEFITPVKFAGIYNTISSALGHQVYEGRWLRDPEYIDQYISFWLFHDKDQKKPHFFAFSTWVDDAVYNLYLVNKNKNFLSSVLPALDSNYHTWEKSNLLANDLFWQYDVRDAMEESISGSRHQKNMRPTINSYMYGNAKALSEMNAIAGNKTLAQSYASKAGKLKRLIEDSLWDGSAGFFEVKYPNGKFAGVREELGYIPWYFNLPDDKAEYAKAWDQLIDTAGFDAPWGITTAERRHPLFRTHGSGHGCEWDGAVWPYATTQTLKGLSNLLNNDKYHAGMNADVFYNALHKYAWAQQKNGQPFIGEYQDEKNGKWLRNEPRSRFYNHSGFADLIISDLVGLKPRTDNVLEIKPLIPEGKWEWFCLDGVLYHGHIITVLWDKTGRKYHKGKGLSVYADGKKIAHKKSLSAIKAKLPGND